MPAFTARPSIIFALLLSLPLQFSCGEEGGENPIPFEEENADEERTDGDDENPQNNQASDADGDLDGDADGALDPTGLEGMCNYSYDCGGSYYASTEACIDASINYWGECRRDELDAYGDCILSLSCEEWGNPDSYNPVGGPCDAEWRAGGDASC